MSIGQVAKLAHVSLETIRFYERQGLLPKAKRKASGYRQFDSEAVDRIQFIKNLQELGFSLKEAADLASKKGIPAAIERINRRIENLKKLHRELAKRARAGK
jgi:MerR family copper efflux transcriptional regulator